MIPQCPGFLQKKSTSRKYQQKTIEKQKSKFSRGVLFHMKTRVSLNYIVSCCSYLYYSKTAVESSQRISHFLGLSSDKIYNNCNHFQNNLRLFDVLPNLKRCKIITFKHCIYELLNNSRLRISGNQEISGEFLNFIE